MRTMSEAEKVWNSGKSYTPTIIGKTAVWGHKIKQIRVPEEVQLSRFRKNIFLAIFREIARAEYPNDVSKIREISQAVYVEYRREERGGTLPVVSILSRYIGDEVFCNSVHACIRDGAYKVLIGQVFRQETCNFFYYNNTALDAREKDESGTEVTVVLHSLMPFLLKVYSKGYLNQPSLYVQRRIALVLHEFGLKKSQGEFRPVVEQEVDGQPYKIMQIDIERIKELSILYSLDYEGTTEMIAQVRKSRQTSGETKASSYAEEQMGVITEVIDYFKYGSENVGYAGLVSTVNPTLNRRNKILSSVAQ